jgi:hypothetical protein
MAAVTLSIAEPSHFISITITIIVTINGSTVFNRAVICSIPKYAIPGHSESKLSPKHYLSFT